MDTKPASSSSQKPRAYTGWGLGYYAEGARGSTGKNTGAGDRSKVEAAILKTFSQNHRKSK